MKKLNYITFDLETTGVNILIDEPVQIYMGVAKGIEKEIEDELLVYTYGDVVMTQGAQNVHKISWEYLQKNGRPAREVAPLVQRFIWDHQPAFLVGQNCLSFDFPMLWNWFSKHFPGKFKHPPVAGIYDTMHMANVVLGGSRWKKLEVIGMELGIPFGDLHGAREDGKLTWRIFQELEKLRRGKLG